MDTIEHLENAKPCSAVPSSFGLCLINKLLKLNDGQRSNLSRTPPNLWCATFDSFGLLLRSALILNSLRVLCDLSVSAVSVFPGIFHRRDAEVAEITQRRT